MYLVIFVFILKLRDHGDGILGLRIIDDPDVKPIEGHEGDLARKFLLVHFFQNLSADLNSKWENSYITSHFDGLLWKPLAQKKEIGNFK